MKKKLKKFLLITFTSSIIYLIIKYILNNNSNNYAYPTFISDEDRLCESNGDWLSIGNQVYFKKSAAYYFTDLNLIYLAILRHNDYKPNNRIKFSLQIQFQLQLRNISTKNNNLNEKKQSFDNFIANKNISSIYRSIDTYELFTVEYHFIKFQAATVKIDFDLGETLKVELNYTATGNLDFLLASGQVKMKIHAIDVSEKMRLPLELKPRSSPMTQQHHNSTSFNKNDSSEILICSKVMFIYDERRFLDFQLWVHLNRLIGYDKIVAYNLPGVEMNQQQTEYFRHHKDSIDVRQLNCIPNIFNSSLAKSRYFRKLDVIKDVVNNEKIYITIDTIAYVLINDCYLENFDKFK